MTVHRALASLLLGLWLATPAPATAQTLSPALRQALRQAQLPETALALWAAPVEAGAAPWQQWRAQAPHNPASLTKLATTWSALERLGPAWRWRTPVWLDGELQPEAGVLRGNLVIQGSGDPSLVLERLWLLLRRVQQAGVREIQGDIVLDNSAFAPDLAAPGDFDGEPWRAGNVRPDALLFNYKSHQLLIRPDPNQGRAWLRLDTGLPLATPQVPLRTGPCVDGRSRLRANWLEKPGQAAPLQLAGDWPAACGEHSWPLADPDPASYNARLIESLWREAGGRLSGRARSGSAPTDRAPSFEQLSPPLAELVRDINKHSNNLMAEQLWLTLALHSGARPTDAATARSGLHQWLTQRLPAVLGGPDWQLENGSGLARGSLLSAQQLGELLRAAWASPVMPELLASLPLAGEDGTMRRDPERFGAARARAHLKTGTLHDVAAIAGYLLRPDGQRLVVVALVQHERAGSARQVLDLALREWAQMPTPSNIDSRHRMKVRSKPR